jgi:predicted nucleic acid-binding protein
MILVDTSVIIGYLQGKSGTPYSHLDAIIEHNILLEFATMCIKSCCKARKPKRSSEN